MNKYFELSFFFLFCFFPLIGKCENIKPYSIHENKGDIIFQLSIYGLEIRPFIFNVYQDGTFKTLIGISMEDVKKKEIYDFEIEKDEYSIVVGPNEKELKKIRRKEVKTKFKKNDFLAVKKLAHYLDSKMISMDEVDFDEGIEFVKLIFKTEKSFLRIIWPSFVCTFNNNENSFEYVRRRDFFGEDKPIYDKVLLYLYSKIVSETPIKPETMTSTYLFKNGIISFCNKNLNKYLIQEMK